MKLRFTLIAFGLLLSTAATAQLSYGVKAGATFSTIKHEAFEPAGDGLIEDAYTVGVHINAIAHVQLGKYAGLQLEPGYAMRGNDATFKYYPEWSAYETNKLHYLQLPVMLRLGIEAAGLEVGPEVSYLIFGSEEKVVDGRDIDYGLNVGAWAKLSDHIFLNGRYYLGIPNDVEEIFASDQNDNLYMYHATNRSINFSLEYRF